MPARDLPPAPPPAEATVGEQLKAARERRGLELTSLARALRIPRKALAALEEDNVAALPADVYARGFLKQYATALGLDPVPLLRTLYAERSRLPPPAKVNIWARFERKRRVRWDFLTPRSVALLVGGLGLAAIITYGLFQVRTYTRAPQLLIFEPPHDIEVREPVFTVRGRTDPTAELLINGERTLVREDGSFEESLGLSDGVNTIQFLARSIGGRETVVTREVLVRPLAAGAPAASPVPSPEPAVVAEGSFSLTVRADREVVWVSLTADGKTAFSGLLLPGSEQTVSGREVAVTSGKAAQTLLRVDGVDAGRLGDTPGVLRDVLFRRNLETGTVEKGLPHGSEKVPPE